MAEESDGIEEAFEGQLRVLVTAAGQIAERIARAREDAMRRAQAASEQEARELASRLAAERRTARTELGNVHRAEWWDRATPEQIGHTYQVARVWAQEDPEAARAEGRMREELRTRYGVDVDKTNADPGAVRAAVERINPGPAAANVSEFDQARQWFTQHDANRLQSWESRDRGTDSYEGHEANQHRLIEDWRTELARADHARGQSDAERARAATENAEAARLLEQADREDSRAEQARAAAEYEPEAAERARAAAAEAEQRDASATGSREDGGVLYDSAERRTTTAGNLEAKGIDHEVVATRMRADVSQALPAAEGVKTATRQKASRARKIPARGQQAPRTSMDR